MLLFFPASANCVHRYDASGAPDGSVLFLIDAYENDADFSEFESCEMLDYNDLLTNTVTKVGGGCSVTRQSATTTDTEYKHFRYSEVNALATTDQAVAGADAASMCGGYKDVSYDSRPTAIKCFLKTKHFKIQRCLAGVEFGVLSVFNVILFILLIIM